MNQNIEELIAQLDSTSISSNYQPLNADQFTKLTKTLEHYASTLAVMKKENAIAIVEEKTIEINNLLKLLLFEVERISGPSMKKIYSSMLLDLLIAFQNLIRADNDINALTGAVWVACRQFQTAPKSICEQVALSLSFVSEMLKDAYDEVDQLSRGVTFDGEIVELDGSTTTYFASSKSVVKFCILCAKKAHSVLCSCTENEFMVLESENISEMVNRLSEKVDDFVSSLDIPLKLDDEILSDSLASILIVCKDLISTLESKVTDPKWILLAEQQLIKLNESFSLTEHHAISR